MDTRPTHKPARSNKLVLPSLMLASLAVIVAPFAIIGSYAKVYIFLALPLGFFAALLAKIALNQIKRGAGTRLDRNLALIAYFLGMLPGLSLCGLLTYQIATL